MSFMVLGTASNCEAGVASCQNIPASMVVAVVAAAGTDPNDLPPGAVWSQVEVLGEPEVRA